MPLEQMLIGLLAFGVVVFATATAGHALLYKRDTRAVIAWVGLIILVPLAGATMYWILGVNRVRRRAVALRPRGAVPSHGLASSIVRPPRGFEPLARVGDKVGPFALSSGNLIEPLENGDEAFPPMLEAISAARHSIALTTYIFDNDDVGRQFADALVDAHARGVAVRVIIDAVGQRYSWPSMLRRLRAAGVPAAAYMPIIMNRNLAALNLRNHRKLLAVDGQTAFTGGMNIRGGNVLAKPSRHPVRDLQFRVRGPVVQDLMSVFVSDWEFVAGESLSGAHWFPPLDECGPIVARAIPDGPDEYFEVLRMIILGALSQARESVLIATPYFLPDAGLISALNTAALRGVSVDLLLPEKNNLKLVQWASFALYWQVLDRGCRIWHSPPPFDHSKLMLVDDRWALVGSTNWDPRSMRLNFELNLECYGTGFCAEMRAWFERRREMAREISQADMDNRHLSRRLRDGIARLLSPYL